MGGPGTVLRCTDCTGVLGRMVRSPTSVRLEMRGIAVLDIPMEP
ncbi:DUF6510 family protein [Nocardioides sp. TF02-7]|nr:DUF6510 family protein [Nocardioides sp. TF02-7]UMG92765.1 DUF6510 family protein [Nocardioides sp. TF02-7]